MPLNHKNSKGVRRAKVLGLGEAQGSKNDALKPLLALIPIEAVWEAGRAFTHGKSKYGQYNFTKGLEVVRLISGALRHIFQALWAENVDEESGAHHLGCAIAGLSMALFTIKNRPELDDRFATRGAK